VNDALILVCGVGAFLVLLVVLGVVANELDRMLGLDDDHRDSRGRNPRRPR